MREYIVNKNAQPNGDHEVHDLLIGKQKQCLPNIENQKNLGLYTSSHNAVNVARRTYATANGCFYCCRESHTS